MKKKRRMIHLTCTKWIKLGIAMTYGTKERTLQVASTDFSYRFLKNSAASQQGKKDD